MAFDHLNFKVNLLFELRVQVGRQTDSITTDDREDDPSHRWQE
jgi:hypothetical protein